MIKNFNIMQAHWKTQFLGEVQEKPIYKEECPKKRGLDSFQI